MGAPTRLEALEELVAEPGWQLFVEHVAQEWGPALYRQRMRTALQSSDPGLEACQVEHTTQEIERLVRWPEDEVKRLRARLETAKLRRVTTTAGPA